MNVNFDFIIQKLNYISMFLLRQQQVALRNHYYSFIKLFWNFLKKVLRSTFNLGKLIFS